MHALSPQIWIPQTEYQSLSIVGIEKNIGLFQLQIPFIEKYQTMNGKLILIFNGKSSTVLGNRDPFILKRRDCDSHSYLILI